MDRHACLHHTRRQTHRTGKGNWLSICHWPLGGEIISGIAPEASDCLTCYRSENALSFTSSVNPKYFRTSRVSIVSGTCECKYELVIFGRATTLVWVNCRSVNLTRKKFPAEKARFERKNRWLFKRAGAPGSRSAHIQRCIPPQRWPPRSMAKPDTSVRGRCGRGSCGSGR